MTSETAPQTTATATFHRHEIELLINRALDVPLPFTARTWRWVRRSKKIAASEAALYRFHDIAAAALTRFDRTDPNAD